MISPASPLLPTLPPDVLERAFPFFLWLDETLAVQAFGASLGKAMPALAVGDPLARHFEVRRPARLTDIESWRLHGRSLFMLGAKEQASLRLRGSPEWPAEGGVLLLLAPVMTSLDELRDLHLSLDDFALHDAASEMLLLARGTQMALQDTHRMAERVRARSQQLSSVIELCADGVAFCDASGQVQHANAALHELLGVRHGQSMVGRPLRDLEQQLHSMADPQAPPPPPFFTLMTPPGAEPCTLVLRRPSHTVLLASSRESHDGGRAFYLHDATKATELDRMKTEFLTTAAHELRTPMVSVYGFTELLLHRPVPEERRRDVLETIHRQASLLISMVNELLDVARIEARQGKDFDCRSCTLGALVHEAAQPWLVAGQRELRLALAHGEALLHVDAQKTVRALGNVLGNAAKYSAPDTPITITTLAGPLRHGAGLGICIRDEGIGMSPEQQARVFERFYRADPSGHVPGTGLGMSLVKEIVELQGGHVAVSSELGRGTQVTLWLPLA